LTTLVAVVGFMASLAVLQQEATAPTPRTDTSIETADKDLLRSIRRIADQLAQTQGEEFELEPMAVRSPDEVAGIAAEARAYRVVDPRRLEARGRAWNDIGFGGPASPTLLWLTLAQDLPGIDLDPHGRRLLVSPTLLTHTDYGAETDERIVVPDGRGGVHELRPDRSEGTEDSEPDAAGDFLLATGVRPDEPLLAHYLMHLRQLERNGQDSVRETTDGLLAASAWAEGEANLVSLYFLFRGVGLVRTVLTGHVGPGDFLDGRLIPEALREATPLDAALLTFVYEDGYDFATARWREAGWSVFDSIPPVTTRELLEPGKPRVDLEWPESVAPAPGMKTVDTDRLGRQAIAELVSIWTGQHKLALAASRGWRGDRLTRWESAPEIGITVWETRWGSAAAAAEFADAFRKVLRRRDPDLTVDSSEQVFQTRFRRFRVVQDAAEVRIDIESH